MHTDRLTLSGILTKAAIVHSVSYFVAGVLAFTLLDYESLWAEPGLNSLMKRIDDPMVMAGPLFQPIRGLLFGAVFYLLRDQCFGQPRGWLTMWVVMAVVGIISTFGPSPGSIEGLIYTTLPVRVQVVGQVEVLAQSLALSGVLFFWVRHPDKRWLTWGMTIAFFVVVLLPILGLLSGLEYSV